MKQSAKGANAPLSDFDRALRAVVAVPKSEGLKMERKEKRKPRTSKRNK